MCFSLACARISKTEKYTNTNRKLYKSVLLLCGPGRYHTVLYPVVLSSSTRKKIEQPLPILEFNQMHRFMNSIEALLPIHFLVKCHNNFTHSNDTVEEIKSMSGTDYSLSHIEGHSRSQDSRVTREKVHFPWTSATKSTAPSVECSRSPFS